MSDILNSAISGMNAIKILIDNTVDQINNPNNKKNIDRRVVIDSAIQESNKKTNIRVKEIYDNYNDFIAEEKRKTDAEVQDENTKIEQLLRLEDLLCQKSNVFNELINDLYAQIEKDIVLEKKNVFSEEIKNKLNNIVFAIKDFDKKLKFLEKDVKESVINNLKKVNNLIDDIHNLTSDINYFPPLRYPNKANDLIEQREHLVDELNSLIGVKVVQDNDNYKVSLTNGITLIDNNRKQHLMPLTSTADDRYISVGYIDMYDQVAKKIEDMIPTATLGALLKFRRDELTHTRNKIGQLTVNFADSINSYHVLGYDMFGHMGTQVFNISQPEVMSSTSNGSSPKISAKWVSTSDAQDTNYILYFKDNHWIVTRLVDHSTIRPNVRTEGDKLLITFDGIELSFEGQNSDGDIYMIKPYSNTLDKLELLVKENQPFAYSSTDNVNYPNRNNAMIINKFYHDNLVNHKETLDQAYQKFSKAISHKCNALEEEVPFKRNMIGILENKKISIPDTIEQKHQELNYEQECYLANAKVLEIAENILNEIIERYS